MALLSHQTIMKVVLTDHLHLHHHLHLRHLRLHHHINKCSVFNKMKYDQCCLEWSDPSQPSRAVTRESIGPQEQKVVHKNKTMKID